MPFLEPSEAGSISQAGAAVTSRNATRINLRIATAGGNYRRIGRVQTMSKSTNNNMQVLRELGAQVAVELKKGISEYTFSIAKMLIHNDAFTELEQGAIFSLETIDESAISPVTLAGSTEILELFNVCALNTVDRQYTAGQATVALNATVVTIGQPQGGVLAEGPVA